MPEDGHVNLGVEIMEFKMNAHFRLLPSLIQCYQNVFADAPWSEWLYCARCQKCYGSNDTELLITRNFTCCDETLIDFWPASKVGQDLKRELIEGSSCWIAVHKGIVIGFCWGFPVATARLALKLELPHVEAILHKEFNGVQQVAYQDELGVLREYRGHGIAKALFHKRLHAFHRSNLTVGVVRTKQSPPSVTYSWFTQKLNYKVIAKYPEDDGRVILARNIETIPEET